MSVANVERAVVRVPYRAEVFRRGAKNPKTMVFLADLAVGLRSVSPEAFVTAVVATVGSEGGPVETRYAGYEGDLWLPLVRNGARIPSETVLRQLATGSALLDDGIGNPFHDTGISAYPRSETSRAVPIEEAFVREILATERDEVMARAARLAGDFLLATDGTVWRRSVGPFHLARPGQPVTVVAATHDLPVGRGADWSMGPSAAAARPSLQGAFFGAARAEEAVEHAATEYGAGDGIVLGTIEILEPGFLPDHDALIAARAVTDAECAGMIRRSTLLAPDHLVAAGRAALATAARIHDLPVQAYGQRIGGARAPAGSPRPDAESLVAAVDAVRSFFADDLSATGIPSRQAMNQDWRAFFEEKRGDECRRFDVYERDRLAVDEAAPDLGLHAEGPRP
ncbi:hypothetical protein [Methylobacterium radiotolerans]|uniref:hypothetical protein n=1 Tax=Methylobacterium radiotolerans TaxID=31998 RepID=UPI0038D0E82D